MNITVVRSRRRTVSLQVKPDGRIEVRAPLRMPDVEIRRFAESHRDWIEKRLRQLAEAKARQESVEPLSEKELKQLTKTARADLTQRCALWAPHVGVTYGRISIRHQKGRWGSCSAKGNLNFNCLLMLSPEWVRDYVVVHELCHRRHMNHSPAFWAAVEAIYPRWREARDWLKRNGEALMLRNPGA